MKYILLIFIAARLLTFSPPAFTEQSPTPEYTIGIEDILEIHILQPEKLDTEVSVAPDGSISCVYIGNVQAKGRTLSQIQEEIQTRLADGYMKYPVVSVVLMESRSRNFFVYGEVNKPGTYSIEENATVLKAISMAGGFTKYGSSSRVKVLRPKKDEPGYETIQVKMKDVMNGHSESDIVLQPEDIIVISEGVF